MMRFLVLLVLSLMPGVAAAQMVAEEVVPGVSGGILPSIADNTGVSGTDNIKNSEQLFCYEVSLKPQGYAGYTLNNMAVTGFCGVMNKEAKDLIVRELFSTPANVSLATSEQCTIRPRMLLRFVRGVDSTDVLLSSPCHSYAIFYGGKVKSYNFKPGAEVMDTIIESLNSNRVDFVSPALLNQLMPIGEAVTAEQQQLLQKKSGPVRNWDTGTGGSSDNQGSAWNNLGL